MAIEPIVLDSRESGHEYFIQSSARYLQNVGRSIWTLKVEGGFIL
jgi:hypothetical protein